MDGEPTGGESPPPGASANASSPDRVGEVPDTRPDQAASNESDAQPRAPSLLHQAISGGVAAALVALIVITLVSGRALSAIIQMAVQVGVPLTLLGYVAWQRILSVRERRSAFAASSASIGQVVRSEVRAFVARGLAAFGGGFYGLVAGAAFIVYQVRSIPAHTWLDPSAWRLPTLSLPQDGWAFLTDTVGPALWSLLLDVGTGWVDGFVYAMTWPVRLMDVIGPIGLGLAMALGVGLHALARHLLPEVDAFSREVEASDPSSFWSPLPEELLPGSGDDTPPSNERDTETGSSSTGSDRSPS